MANADKPLSDLAHLMCFNTYVLHHAFGRYYAAGFGETGFTYAKYVILRTLQEAGPLTLGTLAERVGLEPNSLSPIVKKMAGFGLLRRERDPEDERRITLAIEDYGRDVVAAAEQQMLAGWAQMDVDPEELSHAIELMNRVRTQLERVAMPKLALPEPPDTDS